MFVTILITTQLLSCSSSKNTTNNQPSINIFSEKYYDNAPNNLERLQRLMSGVFVFYHDLPENDSIVKWDINEKNDSIIGYALPVGDVNKVGYWIYNVQFMTSIPNKPVYSSFVNLVQTSRDTLIATFYIPQENITPAKALQEGKKAFEEVKFDALEKSIEITYIKESNIYFKGQSILYLNPRQNNPKKKFQIDYYNVKMKQTSFQSIFYPDKKMDNSLKTVGVNQYMYKIDPQKSPVIQTLKGIKTD